MPRSKIYPDVFNGITLKKVQVSINTTILPKVLPSVVKRGGLLWCCRNKDVPDTQWMVESNPPLPDI
jgi:hypothetical protein